MCVFPQLNEEFQEEEQTTAVFAISMAWFKEWEAFVREKTDGECIASVEDISSTALL